MTLIDEVKRLNSESHAKWYERYFKEYDLEHKIKVSAQQGYTGHLINVLSVRDEYIKHRLDDTKTIEAIKQLLGPGFLVEYKLYYSKDLFSGSEYVSDKKIHISWA
ncbi:hypothetical protein D8786_08515 [Streptococcus mitis]|uniref:Uncharacterized protein n=1 Tax=Streptococcus mitis TaxID=28037 RepID=A0A428HG02_STRMT|nr:hypothetical protein [Streptococcus mitis]RSJ94831.1 hypothetical protein D8786_08515 [Streptococcus mitis]